MLDLAAGLGRSIFPGCRVDITRETVKMSRSRGLHLVERWTRTGPDSLEYAVTIEDPTVWTRPWTVKQQFTKQSDRENRIYAEQCCVEGNYGLPGLLRGARLEDLALSEGRGPDPASKDSSRGPAAQRSLAVVEEDEAERVRTNFRRYLDLGSIGHLLVNLRQRGILTKIRHLSEGRTVGGIPFTRGPLATAGRQACSRRNSSGRRRRRRILKIRLDSQFWRPRLGEPSTRLFDRSVRWGSPCTSARGIVGSEIRWASLSFAPIRRVPG
jgi:hypothetical protein